ncbi:hypothetical protein BWQ96_05885 [Gracilariopsis chorda]|uniref:ASPIC/UnbV domain-containing protein n=1 Tax=Gracilariopsis chorda TaxID=448386 RepID=A0A2V3IQI1_9FLOR|nr:hypothetical protein BWQ96_05885 [Gracilariopsis chorda]|eukprot:PXF44365.1 hypothetical protein BWQ96_05885 [Gracilariopsis chorda]
MQHAANQTAAASESLPSAHPPKSSACLLNLPLRRKLLISAATVLILATAIILAIVFATRNSSHDDQPQGAGTSQQTLLAPDSAAQKEKQNHTEATSPPNAQLIPARLQFQDVTLAANLRADNSTLKLYGGPTVVDIDRDGFVDLILCYHDTYFVRLYFNNGNGTFSSSKWAPWYDTHGISATPISPYTTNMRFSLSVGGNWGLNPRSPYLFEVDSTTRQVRNVTNEAGVYHMVGSGRTALYTDLSMGANVAYPDVLFLNAPRRDPSVPHHFAYENVNGTHYTLRQLDDEFALHKSSHGTVTDVDNDGVMEIVTYWTLHVWKLVAPFKFEDISDVVLPAGLDRRACVAVAEIDFDNDGDFDLYVARRTMPWHKEAAFDDYLLENRNGTYVEVGAQAGVPRNTASRGVTVGDFNNDGLMDVFVVQHKSGDIFLMNNGNGTFSVVRDVIKREEGDVGDHAVAVDYDMDGRVDLMYGAGDHDKAVGRYRILKNGMAMNESTPNRYLHVRVKNAREGGCTPLDAVVEVHLRDGSVMRRRVGSPGDAVAHSYLETLHFGLRAFHSARKVVVTYASGFVDELRDVRAGHVASVGRM